MDPLSTTLPPGDVLAGLAAPRVEDRDAATRTAIAMGPAISSRLLLWEDAPASNRARRLWAYTGAQVRRTEAALRQPRGFDFDHDGTLAAALDALARRHGVLVARDLPPEAQRPVRCALRDVTLLGALDALCPQAGCQGGQRARGELAVTAGREPEYPTAYRGPMRVRAVEVRSTRSTDFAAVQASTQVRLRVDWEWPIHPISSVFLRLDGADVAHEAPVVANVGNVGMANEALVPASATGPLVLAGTASAYFDGVFEEVRVPVPGEAVVHGVRMVATADGQLLLETTDPLRSRGDLAGLGVSAVLLAIADDGEEGVPQVNRVRNPATPHAERWGLRNREGFGALAELRIRVAAPPVKLSFPFVLPAIAW